jgi:hypothetical protein
MASPGRMPAAAPALPGATSVTKSPLRAARRFYCAVSGVSGSTVRPRISSLPSAGSIASSIGCSPILTLR